MILHVFLNVTFTIEQITSNSMAQTRSKSVSRASPPESPQSTPPSNFRESVSLETFDQASRRVIFTEPESIEAIKRLGLTFADFNYKPKSAFKKPGCDSSVTDLLYTKSEQRRQSLIEQALAMREQVFREKERDEPEQKRESSLVMIQRKNLENEQRAFEKARNDRTLELKKLIIQLLRAAFARQTHTAAMERSMSRIMEAERKKKERIQLAQERSISLPTIPQATKSDQPGVWVDRGLERIKEQRRKEAEERKKKALIKEEKARMIQAKSAELFEKHQRGRQQKIDNEDTRYQNWQKMQADKAHEMQRKAQERAAKDDSVVKNGCRIEDEMKQRWVEKLNSQDERVRSACLQKNQELQDRLANTKQRISERTEKAREVQNKHLQMQDEMRKKLDDNDVETEKRLRQMTTDMNLKFVERQFDRDTKRLAIQHRRAAEEYDAQKLASQPSNETLVAEKLQWKAHKLMCQKEAEQNRYLALRTEIMRVFEAMLDDVDPKSLKMLQTLTGIDEREMEQLVEAAKTPASLMSRPSTSSSNRSNLPKVSVPTAQSTPTPFRPRSVLRK